MNWQDEYLEGDKEIVFVALNPTEEAIENNAVFCKTVTFWRILKDAGFAVSVVKEEGDAPYKNMAASVFNKNTIYGFIDLVEDCHEKKSNNVSINRSHIQIFKNKLQKINCKKIVILGHKIAQVFSNYFNLKEEWDSLLKNPIKQYSNSGKLKEYRNYGYLGDIEIDANKIKVYVVPFPETSSIKNKSEYYKLV